MNQFTSVLAAKIGTSQAKALIRVDDLGDAVDAKVVKVWRKILRLIHADPMPRDFLHQLYALLSSVVGTAQAALSTGLIRQAQQVHEDVTAEVFGQLPPGHKIMLAQMASPPQLTEAKATPEQAEQMKGMIFPPQTEAAARSIVHRSTAGVGWEARLAQQTTLAPPGQLASLITTWRATGQTPKMMEEAMMPLVNGVRSTARRVARTEGQRVASQTRLESYEALGDLVIGYQIHATMDSHTRPHHAARNGQTYFKDPKPGQLSSTDMPIPPQESDGSVAHNCRCWITPIVDVQPQIEDDPAAKKLFTDAEANLVPDPASYADWFATASLGERRKAAGSRRLSAAQDRLPPDQTVSWIDVLKLNGELLTAEELTREREEARLARVKAVGDLIDRRRELARKIAQFGYLPPEMGGTRAAVPVPVPPMEPVLVDEPKLAAGRGKPAVALVFAKPIVGPSGAKILGYSWVHEVLDTEDQDGNLRAKKVSDWSKALVNAETGKEIVHQFSVQLPDDTGKIVSLETAAKLLGYGAGAPGIVALKSVGAKLKTLGRLQLEFTALANQKEQMLAIQAQVQSLAVPPIAAKTATDKGRAVTVYTIDGSDQRMPGVDNADSRRSVADSWRGEQEAERGFIRGWSSVTTNDRLKDLGKKIKKLTDEVQAGPVPPEGAVF